MGQGREPEPRGVRPLTRLPTPRDQYCRVASHQGSGGRLAPGHVHPAGPAWPPPALCAWSWKHQCARHRPHCSVFTPASRPQPRAKRLSSPHAPDAGALRCLDRWGMGLAQRLLCPPPRSPGPRGRTVGRSTRQVFRNWMFCGKPGKHPGQGRAVSHGWAGSVLATWAPTPGNLPALVPPTAALPAQSSSWRLLSGSTPGSRPSMLLLCDPQTLLSPRLTLGPRECRAAQTQARPAFLSSLWAHLRAQSRLGCHEAAPPRNIP